VSTKSIVRSETVVHKDTAPLPKSFGGSSEVSVVASSPVQADVQCEHFLVLQPDDASVGCSSIDRHDNPVPTCVADIKECARLASKNSGCGNLINYFKRSEGSDFPGRCLCVRAHKDCKGSYAAGGLLAKVVPITGLNQIKVVYLNSDLQSNPDQEPAALVDDTTSTNSSQSQSKQVATLADALEGWDCLQEDDQACPSSDLLCRCLGTSGEAASHHHDLAAHLLTLHSLHKEFERGLPLQGDGNALVAIAHQGLNFQEGWEKRIAELLPVTGSWDVIKLHSASFAEDGCSSMCLESRRRAVARRCLVPITSDAPSNCKALPSVALLVASSQAEKILAALKTVASSELHPATGGTPDERRQRLSLDIMLNKAAESGLLNVLSMRASSIAA